MRTKVALQCKHSKLAAGAPKTQASTPLTTVFARFTNGKPNTHCGPQKITRGASVTAGEEKTACRVRLLLTALKSLQFQNQKRRRTKRRIAGTETKTENGIDVSEHKLPL